MLLCLPLLAWACQDATNGAPRAAGGGAKKPAAAPVDPAATFDSGLPKEHQGKVAARIGDLTITLKEFERRLSEQAPYARARYGSIERKKEFLDNLVRFEVLAAEAAQRGYDRDPDVVQQMKQTMVRKLMSREVQGLVKLADVTDEEMRQYYEEHSDNYHKPEQVRVSQILVSDEARAKKVHADLVKRVNADRRNYRKVFADVARQSSEDAATKARGGDLRFFAKTEEGGTQGKAVSDAAFAIKKVGDVTLPFQDEAGWHILLLTGRKNRYDRTFEQVKRQIQNRIYRKKKREATDKYVADLKARARVEVHEDVLELVKVDSGAMPRPGGRSVLGPVDPGAAPNLKPGVGDVKLSPPVQPMPAPRPVPAPAAPAPPAPRPVPAPAAPAPPAAPGAAR